MPSRTKTQGLEVVRPPKPNGRPRVFGPERIEAIASQLGKLEPGQGVSDNQDYPTRASANWRAEALFKGLEDAGHPTANLGRRTWLTEAGKFRWAVWRKE